MYCTIVVIFKISSCLFQPDFTQISKIVQIMALESHLNICIGYFLLSSIKKGTVSMTHLLTLSPIQIF